MMFTRIITHVLPHLDEIVAIRLLKQHGTTKYPGIQDAVVTYSSTGEQPEHKSWQEHMNEGTLLIGTGGGPFDEHPTFEQERKEGHSACLLVAKDLGIDKHPIYKRLIELVNEADQMGVHEFHIANRLKTRYRLNPGNPEKAISLINTILDDWEREQKMFVDARHELQVMGSKHIAIVETDNYKMSAAARSLRIPILIQQQKNGHVQIFSDTDRNEIDMKFAVAKIRKAEALMNGMSQEDVGNIPEETWQKQGKIPEAANWFYQIPGQNILNGTETTPDVIPTKIPLEIIVEIVQKNVVASKKNPA